MKRIMIKDWCVVLCALFSITAVHAQVKELEKYADTKNVTYVYISKLMLRMAGRESDISVPGMEMQSMLKKMDGIQIVISKTGKMAEKLNADMRSLVKRESYEPLMQIDDDEGKVNIYYREGKKQSTVVMLVTQPGGMLCVFAFSGKFDLEDVMNMVESSSKE